MQRCRSTAATASWRSSRSRGSTETRRSWRSARARTRFSDWSSRSCSGCKGGSPLYNPRVPVYVLLALAAALFAQAVVRLRRRGRADLAGWDRVALFAAGLAVVWVALLSPLDAVAE